jgi:hypothetical protein
MKAALDERSFRGLRLLVKHLRRDLEQIQTARERTATNSRLEQRQWQSLKPICHPAAMWIIHFSFAGRMLALHCSECDQHVMSIEGPRA